MKSKFLTAAALACAISLGAPGIASAQSTSSVSATGTTTYCEINGVEVPCGDVDPGVSDMPSFDLPSFDPPVFDRPAFTPPVFDRPAFTPPVFERPAFTPPVFERPAFTPPSFDGPATNSSQVTVTASARAVSNGGTSVTSTECTVNGEEVPCGDNATAVATPRFDFSAFSFGGFGG